MVNKIIKTVIVGFGNIAGQNTFDKVTKKAYRFSSHIQAINKLNHFDLVCIVDKSKKARKLANTRFGLQNTFPSLSEAEKYCGKFDLAVVSTPPNQRLDTILQINDVKGVILEKPISNDINDSNYILNYCKKKKIHCEINYWMRFLPEFLNNKKIISNLVGKLQSVVIYYCGGLKNNAVHFIDLTRYLFGEIVSLNHLKNSINFKGETLSNDFNVCFYGILKRGVPIYGIPLKKKFFRENSIEFKGEKGKVSFLNDGRKLFLNKLKPHEGLSKNLEINYDKTVKIKINYDLAMLNLYKEMYRVLNHESKGLSPISNAIINEELISNILNT